MAEGKSGPAVKLGRIPAKHAEFDEWPPIQQIRQERIELRRETEAPAGRESGRLVSFPSSPPKKAHNSGLFN